MKRRSLKCKFQIGCIALVLILAVTSCTQESSAPLSHTDSINAEYSALKTGIYQVFKTGAGKSPPTYLWFDKVKEVNLSSFKTPFDLLDSLLYKPLDRFSYLAHKSQQNQLFNEGQYVGIGFGFAPDSSDVFRVSFVFKSSPLAAAGVTRGWKIKSVNGISASPGTFSDSSFGEDLAGVSNTIVFEDLEGVEHSITVEKRVIAMNTVLNYTVLSSNNKKIGYLSFMSFLEPSIAELNTVFAYFKSQLINELIVDLRYNGGGRVDVAVNMASSIAGDLAVNKVFVNFKYNEYYSSLDTPFRFSSSHYGFGLNRIFFITSESTASASELLINGFKPYMNVYLVGSKTYGKPVGMEPHEFANYDWVLMPIVFQSTNADDEGGYFNGIDVNSNVADDLIHPLGDPSEECLSAVLSFIYQGSFPKSVKSKRPRHDWGYQHIKGLRSEIGAF